MNNEPKNTFIALVKKEDIEKDKDNRIIKITNAWKEVKHYVGSYIYDERKKEIFKIIEIRSKKTIKKDGGIFSNEYWEIDYSGLVGLSKGVGRRTYILYSIEYEVLKKQRIAFLELIDEFEKWDMIKKQN